MKRSMIEGLASAAVILALPRVYAVGEIVAIYLPGKTTGEEWHLVMADVQIAFLGRSKDPAQDQSQLPRFPLDGSVPCAAYHFRRSGDTLQVFLRDNEKSASKVQAEKDGWYLTGKCTEKGGEVILTMGVEQFSHWSFLPAKILDPEVQRFYIRNVGPDGKDAWLWMEDKGTRYRGGRETRKPVLSFEKQEVFNVEGGPHSGSK